MCTLNMLGVHVKWFFCKGIIQCHGIITKLDVITHHNNIIMLHPMSSCNSISFVYQQYNNLCKFYVLLFTGFIFSIFLIVLQLLYFNIILPNLHFKPELLAFTRLWRHQNQVLTCTLVAPSMPLITAGDCTNALCKVHLWCLLRWKMGWIFRLALIYLYKYLIPYQLAIILAPTDQLVFH